MRFRSPTPSPFFSLPFFPMRSLFPICAMLLLPLSGRADTVAPFAQDARFKQKVSLRVEGIPVSDLLTQLSAKTGIPLRAEGNVGDDKVAAFCPARPLGDTLNELAALYNDEWQMAPLPNGQTRWLLIRRLSARHYEDNLEQAAGNRFRALLDEQVKALDETPEQFAKRPANDRIRKNLEDPSAHGRQATRLYSQLSREQRDTLFAAGFVNISFATSTPTQQNIAREGFNEVVTTLKALDEKQRAEFPDVHIVIDAPESLEQHGARFRLTRTNNAGLSALQVQVVLGQHTLLYVGEFESADEWLLPPHGNPYTRKPTVRGKATTIENRAKVEDMATTDLPTVDVLRKIGKEGLWLDRLRTLSTIAEVPVLADCYRSPALIHDLSPDDAPSHSPVALLDAFCKHSGYLWWMQGKTLLLRKRDWYAQRRYEVSDRWMRDIATRLRRQKNIPTYGDLCRLLELTPKQISGMNAALSNDSGGEAMANLDAQEGLRELLTLIQAGSESFASLPTGEPSISIGEPSADEAARQRLSSISPPPQQAALTGAFLNIMRQPTTPANLRGFSAQVHCATPALLKIAQAPATQNTQIIISWKLEGNTKPIPFFDQHWLLWLPLQIPNDRSDKTQIEVTPEDKK